MSIVVITDTLFCPRTPWCRVPNEGQRQTG